MSQYIRYTANSQGLFAYLWSCEKLDYRGTAKTLGISVEALEAELEYLTPWLTMPSGCPDNWLCPIEMDEYYNFKMPNVSFYFTPEGDKKFNSVRSWRYVKGQVKKQVTYLQLMEMLLPKNVKVVREIVAISPDIKYQDEYQIGV